MTDPQHAIWLERIARYIEGTLPVDELKPLEEALRTESALRRVYLEYVIGVTQLVVVGVGTWVW